MNTVLIANIIGFTAAGLGTVMFLPQAIQCWKTKKTKDISFLTYALLAISAFLWTVYAIILMLYPVMIVNSIICVISLFVLVLKRKYG